MIERLCCHPLDQHLTRVVEVFRREIDDLVRNLRPDLFVIDPHTPEIPQIAHQLAAPYVFLNNSLFNGLDDDTPLANTAPYLSYVPELISCPQEFDFPEQQRRGNRKLYYVGAEVDLQRQEELFDWSDRSRQAPHLLFVRQYARDLSEHAALLRDDR